MRESLKESLGHLVFWSIVYGVLLGLIYLFG